MENGNLVSQNKNINFEYNIEDEKITKIAKLILKDMGIKRHHLGFKYWATAACIALEFETSDNSKLRMMELYSMVAKKHKTTASKVEKAMRYAYATIDLKQYFNVTYSINNSALLFLLTDTIKEKIFIL